MFSHLLVKFYLNNVLLVSSPSRLSSFPILLPSFTILFCLSPLLDVVFFLF
uniref:Uncharacterized protein n=1 Tax=Anopheles atroparvus TaxID=41427 RepID=A0AAG5CVT4_ANOAO